MPIRLCALALLVALGAPAAAQGGFYGTAGGAIVDPSGQPVILKGVGLGGWLVPEGYMLHIAAPDGGSPTSIRNQIVDLIGEADADAFYELYRANYVAEADIAAIAAWGYDHVRLPFHYKDLWDPATESFREEGFRLFDTFLEWCRTHGLTVVLDMHAAPGGQNDGNISDSGGVARLWTEPDPYQDWTVAIWAEIARRYADETIILGYDLINEPVLPESVPSSDLRALYVRITDAVRAVDPNHILFIEGNYYATDFGALETPWDDNMVYAFHKYWNAPDQGSIQYLVNLREATGVPLWLGETGENSNPWFYATRRLVEANGIGWNWWTHKKVNSTNTPVTAPFARGYERVIAYWRGDGPRPTPEQARAGLFEMARSLALDRTVPNPGVLDALFDDAFGTTARPFRDHAIPGTIQAVDYDIGNNGVAYTDADPWAVSGTPGSGNTGGAYRNDGVDIQTSTDPLSTGFNVGWVQPRETLQFTATVEEAGTYDVELRVATPRADGTVRLAWDGTTLGSLAVPSTGDWQRWQSIWLRGVALPAGEGVLRVTFRTGEYNLSAMRFFRVGGTSEAAAPQGLGELRIAPNPAADGATVTFDLAQPETVAIEVLDAVGRRVVSPAPRLREAGTHRVRVDARELAPGAYVVRVEAGGATRRRRLTVLR